MRKTIKSSAGIAAMLLVLGVQNPAAGSVLVDRVVAVVNGEVITLSDLQREEGVRRAEGIKDQRLVLEDMIDRKIQMAAAKREGMDATDKEVADAIADIKKRNSMDDSRFKAALEKEGLTLEEYKSELREQMTLSRLFNKFVRSGISIDEAEARAFYERNKNNYTQPEEIRVRQIFFKLPDNPTPARIAAVRERAEDAMARAQKGEDFARLVKELSESANAAQGGDLGFLQRGQAVREIEEATRGLKQGDIAGPIRFAGGFHIIRVEEIRKPVKPYEKMKDEITKMLYDQKLENTYRTWLQTLRSKSTVENRL